jgi:hypothetical protein
MITRWEHEALNGVHGEDARERAMRSWGGFLGWVITGLFAVTCFSVVVFGLVIWKIMGT